MPLAPLAELVKLASLGHQGQLVHRVPLGHGAKLGLRAKLALAEPLDRPGLSDLAVAKGHMGAAARLVAKDPRVHREKEDQRDSKGQPGRLAQLVHAAILVQLVLLDPKGLQVLLALQGCRAVVLLRRHLDHRLCRPPAVHFTHNKFSSCELLH